jgi:uncharacterized membrane protein HdeD (DUF308 family)
MLAKVFSLWSLAAISCLMTYIMVTTGLGLEIKSWTWIIIPGIIQVIIGMIVAIINSEESL